MSDRPSSRVGWRDRENDAKNFEEIRRLTNQFHGMESENQEKTENDPPKAPQFKVKKPLQVLIQWNQIYLKLFLVLFNFDWSQRLCLAVILEYNTVKSHD